MKAFKVWGLAMFVVLLFASGVLASEHPKIPLLDEQGNNVIEMAKKHGQKLVLNGVTYYKGAPYSSEQTCGACHDVDAITKAYHFQIGATEVSDDWGEKHPQYHDKYLTSPGQFGFW